MKTRIHLIGLEASKPLNKLACGLTCRSSEEAVNTELDPSQVSQLLQTIQANFEVGTADGSSVWVYPHDGFDLGTLRKIDDEAKRKQKICFFFSERDDLRPMSTESAFVYRTSAYASLLGPRERIMPLLCSDPLWEIERSEDLKKIQEGFSSQMDRIRIGFCGYTSTAFNRFLYRVMGRTEKTRGLTMRQQLLDLLEKEFDSQELNFVRREQFRAGLRGSATKLVNERLRKEYLQNLLEANYALSIRGKGNFSTRLYEALAVGRIPIWVARDERLPFDDEISWQKYLLKVPYEDHKEIKKFVLKFHDQHSPTERLKMAQTNRELWKSHLSAGAFLKKVILDEVARNRSAIGQVG